MSTPDVFADHEKERMQELLRMAVATRYPPEMTDLAMDLCVAHSRWCEERFGTKTVEKWEDEIVDQRSKAYTKYRKIMREAREAHA